MKKHPLTNIVRLVTAAVVALAAGTASAQTQVFSEDFEIDHTLDNTYLTNSIGGSNVAHVFFDYSSVGIPSAPHSTGGSTHGLKLSANLLTAVQAFPSGISVSPAGFNITDNFDMHFDMWMNYNGPMPGGGSGTTTFGGAGYGTAGASAQVAGNAFDSVLVGATIDGGSSADYRIYGPAVSASYQDVDHIIRTDTNSPSVYFAAVAGSRNNTATGNYYVTNFPSGTVPAAQLALYPQQTNSTTGSGGVVGAAGRASAGTLAFGWHDVTLRKVANVITYLVDGKLIARADVTDAGTLGGGKLVFSHFDSNATASTDTNAVNLQFTLIDNVTVTNFANVVTVTSTVPTTAEGSVTPAVFTITRTSSGTPLTVFYTLSGAAVNGVDYTNAAGGLVTNAVTFSATSTATNVSIYPVDDNIPEITENIFLSIDASTNFVGAGLASVTISDNEPPQLTIQTVATKMYERTNDYASFKITRLGNTNTAPFNVNLAFTGATYGTDFYTNSDVTMDTGAQTVTFKVFPIENGAYTGNKTLTATIATGGYTIGAISNANIAIVDANFPAETVLFSDALTNDTSASWTLAFCDTNSGILDYTATFGYDYSPLQIPAAPHGGGSTLGLFLAVNKNDAIPVAAAVNLYPNSQSFSGNYALRFDMFINQGAAGASSSECVLFGINHSGTKTNWFRNSPGGVPAGWTFDGIFYSILADGTGFGAGNVVAGDYVAYSSPTTGVNEPTQLTPGATATSQAALFKSPPYATTGIPANKTGVVTLQNTWADVELSQIGNNVTLRVNNSTIQTYSNATAYANGNIMVGYVDPFDGINAGQDSFVVIQNLRVVRLNGLKITSFVDLGANVQIDFTFDLTDSAAGFTAQSASVVTGPYADVAGTIIQLSPGTYRATVAKSGDVQFYRIRHL